MSWSLENLCRRILDQFREKGLEGWVMRLRTTWKYLCDVKHGEDVGRASDHITRSDVMLDNFHVARKQILFANRVLPPKGLLTWKPSRPGLIRLDVDVSFHNGGRIVGVGFILRDHLGSIIAAVARRIGYTETVLMGELHATMLGIGFCLENDIGPVVVFSDSLLAIHVLHEKYGGTDSLSDELFEVFEHAKRHVVFDFCHVRREGNQAAHRLAEIAVNSRDVMIWKSDFPSWLLDIVHSDLS